ncbi:hypothetical protein AAGT15_07080 [Burkholderia pyrrocinia]|uniref:Uncharacterized protein n=1 Tax=Burkholderia pyrrocinia TaxID=60550 RepID=A0ABZ3BVI1_BURPY
MQLWSTDAVLPDDALLAPPDTTVCANDAGVIAAKPVAAIPITSSPRDTCRRVLRAGFPHAAAFSCTAIHARTDSFQMVLYILFISVKFLF